MHLNFRHNSLVIVSLGGLEALAHLPFADNNLQRTQNLDLPPQTLPTLELGPGSGNAGAILEGTHQERRFSAQTATPSLRAVLWRTVPLPVG